MLSTIDNTYDPVFALQIEAEYCRRSFEFFVKRAWEHIDPAPLVWGEHMSAICTHLQKMGEGKLRKLIITIAPGHAKSMIVSVLFPAWMWARNPKWQNFAAAHNRDLCMRDAVRSRTLMMTPWFRERFMGAREGSEAWDFSEDENNKGRYVNTRGGARTCVSVGSGTGFRADHMGIDDPLNAMDATSKIELEKVIEWYKTTTVSRFNNPKTATRVIIMQRLAENDLVGYLLENDKEFVHLNLPTEYEERNKCVTPFWSDPRTEEGQLLFPELFDASVVTEMKRSMGSFVFASQHQQRPIPLEGGMIKASYFEGRWDTLEDRYDQQNIYVDATFRKTEDNDFVAIGVFGKKGPNLFLLDLVWERMTFTQTLTAIKALKHKWPRTTGIYVEDKANGDAIIDTLKAAIPGVNPIKPEGGKEARVSAITPLLEAGNLFLPRHAKWVDRFIAEACAFPKAPHDDAIDMCAHAVNHMLIGNKVNRFMALAEG